MDENTKVDLAKSEYLQIQSHIDAFDSRAFTVKAWSVTFSLAAMAGAFASHSSAVLLVAGLSSMLFWFTEAHWKTIQTSYYDRLDTLEEFFATGDETFIPMQLGSSWAKSFRTRSHIEVFSVMFKPHVGLPHFPVFLIAVLLYTAWFYGWITV